ncbi:hypothetical protein GCWU000321_01715 [Dialister invisus DSM 15470]|uniref:Uncharacterized protein n=1 Tax=Dialister invisus DSM 15470 TaxID=592028 RepID=C9LQ83_9FIRM|nr:hypothetical protein GCWU000321_01715 [Dialister invisus DSM 15470]
MYYKRFIFNCIAFFIVLFLHVFPRFICHLCIKGNKAPACRY